MLIISFIVSQVDLRAFAHSLLSAKPGWILAAVFAGLLDYTVTAWAWQKMLAANGFDIPFMAVMRVIWVSNFIGAVTPSSMGADVVKVVGLGRYMKNTSEALSSLAIFRLAGYAILFLMAAVSAFIFPERIPDSPMVRAITISLAAGAGLAFLGAALSKRAVWISGRILRKAGLGAIQDRIERLYSTFVSYVVKPRVLLIVALGAFALQILRVTYVYLLSMAMGFNVDLAVFFVFVPVITAVMLIPVTFSGIGLREGSYIFLFGYAGLAPAQALGMSALSFAIDVGYMLAGGIVYLKEGMPKSGTQAK
jgi:hypothetical protein